MRRITYWALSTVSALILLLGYHTSLSGPASSSAAVAPISGAASTSGGQTTSAGTNPPEDASGSSTPSTSATAGTSGTSSRTSSGTSSGTAKPSKVTGTLAQTRWGPVQVELTVSGAKVANVTVTQYPNGNGRDQEINSYALPILIQETIDAQSADIDMVSGATVTSGGYIQSLQSALDQAKL